MEEKNGMATETMADDEIASSVPALSNAVLHHFSELRNQIAVSNKRNMKIMKLSDTRIASTRSNTSAPVSKPKKGSASPVASFEAKAQVISDVASFSDRPYPLEDALEITDTP
ncbi:MAG: hypothetical protein SGARI_004905, partial [Bacillariaceae sp.]